MPEISQKYLDESMPEMSKKAFDNLLVGRVEPHIYAFTTQYFKNYLKVGDTYRPVPVRIKEWENVFDDIALQKEWSAKITDEVFFRDYSVHKYLEEDLVKERLDKQTKNKINEDAYFSNEFFKDTKTSDIDSAINDIKKDFEEGGQRYQFYNAKDLSSQEQVYESTGMWSMRPNQKAAVDAFQNALINKRSNLLMYAVMRFGKSFTSMCCAQVMNDGDGANFVVIVSAKADVKDEWRKTIQSAENFRNDYVFLTSDNLEKNYDIIASTLKKKKVALFLTLQDLKEKIIKPKHKQLFERKIDLLIVDETHFGARSEKYGEILRKDEKKIEDLDDDSEILEDLNDRIKILDTKVTLHLSGTPYRILMGSEFEKDDIIAFCQFPDIVKEKNKWDQENLNKKGKEEWDNPYFGFPKMLRFAFNPNVSSMKKIEALRAEGKTAHISAIFEPEGKKRGKNARFIHEKEVLDLLKIIDGSKSESNILGFLNYPKLKNGKMCRHIVFVLPRCASCDALENLIRGHDREFKNLQQYEIVNISGAKGRKLYKEPENVKNAIKTFEKKGSKTITLTAGRMLTGSTVEQWDTMVYLKSSSSPQEYDQAIFRLQNQYIKLYADDKGNTIKYNMKPQTLLVDFDPTRMFVMQELKAQIYNVNVEKKGNSELKDRIKDEIDISPIIYFNNDKIMQVSEKNIMDVVSEYSRNRGVAEETNEIPVDLGLKDVDIIWQTISQENEIGTKEGFSISPNEGDGDEIGIEGDSSNDGVAPGRKKGFESPKEDGKNKEKDPIKQFRMYYARILFYSFLTKDEIVGLGQLINTLDSKGQNFEENRRICKNLGLNKKVLKALKDYMNPFMLSKLDYKIQHLSKLSHDVRLLPLERAAVANSKFGRLSESEVVTPTEMADKMINALSAKVLKKSISENQSFIDIASKEGEFAMALCKRLKKMGYNEKDYKNKIYSIPTSSVTYEFTRKIYEILGLNEKNIASKFNTYDLLNVALKKNVIDYEKVANLLLQKKSFDEITLDDNISEKERKMRFSMVVGNPPYHLSDGGHGESAKAIYNEFVNIAKSLNPENITMIMPAKWYVGGKGLDDFREMMLNDSRIKKLYDFANSKECFKDVDIAGGVCFFLWDAAFSGDCEIINCANDEKICNVRPLNEFKILARDNKALNIIRKVLKKHGTGSFLSDRVSSRKPFGLPTNYEPRNSGVPCWFIQKIGLKYASSKDINDCDNILQKWKFLAPKSPIAGQTDFSKPVGFYYEGNTKIAKPGECCTESFLVLGSFKTKNEAMHFKSYIFTKVVRFLLLQAVVSQDVTKQNYVFVPDLGTYDCEYTDQILCEKWGITKAEWDYIDLRIKSVIDINKGKD